MHVQLDDVETTIRKYDGKDIPKAVAVALLKTTGFKVQKPEQTRVVPEGCDHYVNRFKPDITFNLVRKGNMVEGPASRTLRSSVLRALPFAQLNKKKNAEAESISEQPDTSMNVSDAETGDKSTSRDHS